SHPDEGSLPARKPDPRQSLITFRRSGYPQAADPSIDGFLLPFSHGIGPQAAAGRPVRGFTLFQMILSFLRVV
ncbi:MAG: hypothetical protein ABSE59_10685, partial [Opitutaceae bacterium]